MHNPDDVLFYFIVMRQLPVKRIFLFYFVLRSIELENNNDSEISEL